MIVYQKSAALADAAREYERARLAGRMEDALEIYRQATGDQRELGNADGKLPPLDSCWWTFGAADVIRRAYNVTYEEVAAYLHRDPDDIISHEDYVRAACALAARRHGGEWVYYYEY